MAFSTGFRTSQDDVRDLSALFLCAYASITKHEEYEEISTTVRANLYKSSKESMLSSRSRFELCRTCGTQFRLYCSYVKIHELGIPFFTNQYFMEWQFGVVGFSVPMILPLSWLCFRWSCISKWKIHHLCNPIYNIHLSNIDYYIIYICIYWILLDSFWGSKSTWHVPMIFWCLHVAVAPWPAWPRKRIAVGQAQGQVFALKLAEKLAREACFSVMDNRYHGYSWRMKKSRLLGKSVLVKSTVD